MNERNSYPRGRPPWGFVDIAVIFALLFLFSVFFAAFGLPLANLVLRLLPGSGGIEEAVLLAGGFLQSFLMILLILVSAWIRKAPLSALGFGNFSWKNLLLYGIIGGMGVFLMVTVIMSLLISLLPAPPQPQPVAEMILKAKDWRQIFPLLLLVGVFAPVSEEMFFRGFIYPVLRSRLGVVWGITAVACLFGLIHFDLVRFIPLALGGACLAAFCEKSKSIYPAVAAHSIWNTVMTLLVVVYNMTL